MVLPHAMCLDHLIRAKEVAGICAAAVFHSKYANRALALMCNPDTIAEGERVAEDERVRSSGFPFVTNGLFWNNF